MNQQEQKGLKLAYKKERDYLLNNISVMQKRLAELNRQRQNIIMG